MIWVVLEAAVALGLFVALVWWTVRDRHSNRPDDTKKDE